MPVEKTTCAAQSRGAECWEVTVIQQPLALCRRHLAAVMHQATQVFIAAEASPTLQANTDEARIGAARAIEIQSALSGRHPAAVYFITNGTRIKIGYTTNLKGRVGTLSLREADVLLLLRGGQDLEKALHRRFLKYRVHNTEWFEFSGEIRKFLRQHLPDPTPARVVVARVSFEKLNFPDGLPVERADQPDLYRVFQELCAKQGSATKDELTEAGPFESRDTVRRALDVWKSHGVQVRKVSRAEQFYLPDTTDSDD